MDDVVSPSPPSDEELDAIEKRLWFDMSEPGDAQLVINACRSARAENETLRCKITGWQETLDAVDTNSASVTKMWAERTAAAVEYPQEGQ